MTVNNLKQILSFVLIILVIIFVSFKFIKQENTITDYEYNIEALSDTIKKWKDIDGNNVSTIALITADNLKLLDLADRQNEKLNEQNVAIANLVDLVKKYKLKNQGDSAIIVDNETKVKIKDTIDNKAIANPTWNTLYHFRDKWTDLRVDSKLDSIMVDLVIKNQYSVVIGEKSRGLFKKPYLFAEVTNYNPSSENTAMRAYQVRSTVKNKPFSFGPSITYGVNSQLEQSIIIGVSLQYSLIKF